MGYVYKERMLLGTPSSSKQSTKNLIGMQHEPSDSATSSDPQHVMHLLNIHTATPSDTSKNNYSTSAGSRCSTGSSSAAPNTLLPQTASNLTEHSHQNSNSTTSTAVTKEYFTIGGGNLSSNNRFGLQDHSNLSLLNEADPAMDARLNEADLDEQANVMATMLMLDASNPAMSATLKRMSARPPQHFLPAKSFNAYSSNTLSMSKDLLKSGAKPKNYQYSGGTLRSIKSNANSTATLKHDTGQRGGNYAPFSVRTNLDQDV
jgi:hypothetical protein